MELISMVEIQITINNLQNKHLPSLTCGTVQLADGKHQRYSSPDNGVHSSFWHGQDEV